MPEVEDISPPEIPRNSPSSSVADRAENQARSPDKDSNVGDPQNKTLILIIIDKLLLDESW